MFGAANDEDFDINLMVRLSLSFKINGFLLDEFDCDIFM